MPGPGSATSLTPPPLKLATLRRAVFEVVPQELLAVFDQRELLLLINGHPDQQDKGAESSGAGGAWDFLVAV